MEASVVVCHPLRPRHPCYPESTRNSRDGLVKTHAQCTHGASAVRAVRVSFSW